MIFITGDLHGDIDIHKLNTQNFNIQNTLSRSDYLIICGDFGLVWDNSEEEKYWLKWLDNKPWTTLWIDGNHENFNLLKNYPYQTWQGGKIQKITDNIIHLCRGSIFDIDGRKIFAFGGAESHDKPYRRLGRSIWEEELPSPEEMNQGLINLDSVNWNVDIVITHSVSRHIQNHMFKGMGYKNNALNDYFDQLDSRLEYNMWFSGHYHRDMQYDKKHFLIYNNIIKLTDSGFERICPPSELCRYIDRLPVSFSII